MDGLTVRSVSDFMVERRVAFKWQNGDVFLIDNMLVMHSRRTIVPPSAVYMPRCAGRHFALQWDVTRAPHSQQSVLAPRC